MITIQSIVLFNKFENIFYKKKKVALYHPGIYFKLNSLKFNKEKKTKIMMNNI